MDVTSNTTTYRAARDLLRTYGGDYARAVAEFRWPQFGDSFNWAVDWFDANARGNAATGLWIVEEDGTEASYSFDELATRSDRIAAFLAEHGVGRGDRVLLMLGNQVELWETQLAVMKLGAVIMPAGAGRSARSVTASTARKAWASMARTVQRCQEVQRRT